MNEEKLLRKIFGDDQKWQGRHALYDLDWCALCRTASIHNPNCGCHGSSCNAGGCKNCGEDFDVFHKCKTTVREYLTEQECAAHDKALKLIKWILESLTLGEQEIDWKRLKTTGQTSRNDDEVFKDRFQPEWNFDYEPHKTKNDAELHSRVGTHRRTRKSGTNQRRYSKKFAKQLAKRRNVLRCAMRLRKKRK